MTENPNRASTLRAGDEAFSLTLYHDSILGPEASTLRAGDEAFSLWYF